MRMVDKLKAFLMVVAHTILSLSPPSLQGLRSMRFFDPLLDVNATA
jgi:hypothetical protein